MLNKLRIRLNDSNCVIGLELMFANEMVEFILDINFSLFDFRITQPESVCLNAEHSKIT